MTCTSAREVTRGGFPAVKQAIGFPAKTSSGVSWTRFEFEGEKEACASEIDGRRAFIHNHTIVTGTGGEG